MGLLDMVWHGLPFLCAADIYKLIHHLSTFTRGGGDRFIVVGTALALLRC